MQISRKFRQGKQVTRWLWGTAGMILLLNTNWRLLIATSTGVAMMGFVYISQSADKRLFWQRLRQWLHHPNRRLAVSVLSGGVTVLGCYIFLTLLETQTNGWVGFAQALQFFATFGVLGAVTYQFLAEGLRREEHDLDFLVMQLTDSDALKRLIAIRQLQQRVLQYRLPFAQEKSIREYCIFLLEKETSPVIRNAALETIEALQYLQPSTRSEEKNSPPQLFEVTLP